MSRLRPLPITLLRRFFIFGADVEWQLGFGFSIGDASDGIDKSHVSGDIVSSGLEVVADDCSCFVYCGPI